MKRLQQLYKQQFKFLEYELNLTNIEYAKQTAKLSKAPETAQPKPLNVLSKVTNENETLESVEYRKSMRFLKTARKFKGQEALLKMKQDEKKRIFSTNEDFTSSSSYLPSQVRLRRIFWQVEVFNRVIFQANLLPFPSF